MEDFPKDIEEKGLQLIKLIGNNDVERVRMLLENSPQAIYFRDENGSCPLHLAASHDNLEMCKLLISNGHSWNETDKDGVSAGDIAWRNKFMELYEFLVDEGCRTEILLSYLEKDSESIQEENTFLKQKLKYIDNDNKLVDEENNGVMMGWEKPLMVEHARVICYKEGISVLNIGFGLGIIDTEIQKYNPGKHTIIEAHPDVYQKMLDMGWDKKPNVRIIFGKWQDVLDQLETYDGIFFDTFGEYYKDLKEFHEHLPNILNEDGVYSYFNGLCGGNQFFHDVYCKIAEIDLKDIGLSTVYEELDMVELSDDEWKDIKRAYWTLPKYRLPTCRLDF
jgi:protein arginine N-methyltransferase 2